LAGQILNTFKQKVSELKLIPASGGCFEFKANDELIYSKLATGAFPDERTMLEQVQARLSAKR
jgi:selenoprotein W-related protein